MISSFGYCFLVEMMESQTHLHVLDNTVAHDEVDHSYVRQLQFLSQLHTN